MKCPKCNSNNSNDAQFCGECGAKLPKQKKKEHKTVITDGEPSKKNLWITVIIIVIGIGVLAGLLIPYKTVLRTEQVPYEATEEYSIREPYSGTETYYEEIPYQDEDCSYRNAKYNSESTSEWLSGGLYKQICTITNYETEPISFTYTLRHFVGDDEDNTYGPRSVTIGSGETFTKEQVFSTEVGSHRCDVTAEQVQECKSVTRFRSVAKERTTTNYKDVVKTRKVTKMRTDTIHTQVNWLFGVKMPWLAEWRDEGQVKWYYPLNEVNEE